MSHDHDDRDSAPELPAAPERPLLPPGPRVTPNGKQYRGFAAMDPELVRQIAKKGGRAAHEQGTAHEFTTEEARAAGRKGGKATHARRNASKIVKT
jgi:uncharacterized protein